ncbi:MAG: alpha/beta hydrolase [Myxococcota bacterium]
MITARQWYEHPSYIEHAGHLIFYKDEGSGEPIVLLHGFPTSSWDWYKLWPRLTARYRCVAFDFLGFGYSDKPRRHRYTMHEQADITEAVIERAGLRAFKLVAHDYGVTVAQELLARQAEGARARYEIESVVLFNGGLFPETHRARLIQKLLLGPLGPVLNRVLGFSRFSKSLSAVFGADTQPSEYELAEFWRLLNHSSGGAGGLGGARVTHALIRYMSDRKEHRERWVRALRQSAAPIRLINGSVDPVSGKHLVDRYREIIDPEADAIDLPTIGHYPQVEDPEACLAGLFGFTAGGYAE